LLGDGLDTHCADVARPAILDSLIVNIDLLLLRGTPSVDHLSLACLLAIFSLTVSVQIDIVQRNHTFSDSLLFLLFGFLLFFFRLELVVSRLLELVEDVLELVDERSQGLLVARFRLLEILRDRVVVVIDQVGVVGLLGSSALDPPAASFQHICFFHVEVTLDDRFEALGGVLELAEHGKLDVAIAHDIRVAFVAALAIRSARFLLETWLVKVHLL